MFVNTKFGQVYYSYYTTSKNDLTAVYLHGLGGDSAVWEFMKEPTFKAKYNFMSIDLPGHGLSYRPGENIDFREFTQSLEIIFQKEKISNITLIGHCFGDLVVLDFAIKNPFGIKSIILINSTAKAPQILKACKLFLPISYIFSIHKILEHIDHDRYYGTKDISFRRFYSDIKYTGLRTYLLIINELAKKDFGTSLKKINHKTLIIGGKRDIILPLKHQKYLATNISNASLEIIDTNHISVINDRDKIRESIIKYLGPK